MSTSGKNIKMKLQSRECPSLGKGVTQENMEEVIELL
jgi:hypothetical protein